MENQRPLGVHCCLSIWSRITAYLVLSHPLALPLFVWTLSWESCCLRPADRFLWTGIPSFLLRQSASASPWSGGLFSMQMWLANVTRTAGLIQSVPLCWSCLDTAIWGGNQIIEPLICLGNPACQLLLRSCLRGLQSSVWWQQKWSIILLTKEDRAAQSYSGPEFS